MTKYIEKAESMTLPVIVMRGLVVFPNSQITLEIARPMSLAALDAAPKYGDLIFLVAQKQTETENPEKNDIYTVGTVAKIKHVLKVSSDYTKVLAEGLSRGEIIDLRSEDGFFTADVIKKDVFVEGNGGDRGEALIREINSIFSEYIKFIPKPSEDLVEKAGGIRSVGALADYLAANVIFRYQLKQKILEIFDPVKRLETLCTVMRHEIEIMRIEYQLHRKVKSQIDKNQRDYYLREQMKAIQNELGEEDQSDEDNEEYYDLLDKSKLPQEVREKAEKELRHLSKLPFGSPEATVIRSYLDCLFEIPFGKYSRLKTNIAKAKSVLDNDHFGLTKVKERILEFLAAKQFNDNYKSQILCLSGPPGVGKTSIASSIAKATGRKYVRISLGGIRDEADIRGHRKTYIGSMPGRIIAALKAAGTMNPLILFDEVDKMSSDFHGDPASALLEVLDVEQNKSFRDHFLEFNIDLSDCMFICTANTTSTIPRPLLDRMDVVSLDSYTENEKVAIAKEHLIPRQLLNHGFRRSQFKMNDQAIRMLIENYTREAGVRNLDREIASLCRKAAKRMLLDSTYKAVLTPENLEEIAGHRKFAPEKLSLLDEVGVVNGLAWTEIGGEILQIEVAVMNGTGKIELTGSLGDVMKESAHAAVTYIRTRCAALGIDADFYKNRDIHIHIPDGATPKDGPSAGISMTTALVSALSSVPVCHDLAMTGEVTLRGRVLPIGGLKEKSMAAFTHGIKRVLIPQDNIPDLEDIDNEVSAAINFIPVSSMDEVLALALTSKPSVAADSVLPAASYSDITAPKNDTAIIGGTQQSF